MGRLPGARQIAGVHLVEGDSTRVEVCAQGPSLLYPKLRQRSLLAPHDDAPPMKPPQPRPGDDEPAPLPHVRVTATTDSAELRSQLAVRDLTAVRAVSVSAEPEAAAALSWTLQQLPRLEQLRLQRAPLPGGLRAFGSGLFQLRVLWLVGCALETLDGVCALPRLQELYVARNRLTDVSICSCLDQLQVPDHDGMGRMADVR
ncbi:Leucine-rich repeat-containing protein 56 [Amphibalanus amphitrite]|uniref:Leucine-rich repeat-containing protein 56 n=1 Tax=Amphibalanus amphitrite TaxID=1232801 RepID=A0A6A4VRD6_AMPAM|nr:Leucine-rich repeat-containing protein 56 [Amphibalanus amphitrite]